MPEVIRKLQVDRRSFLRGAGAAIALPWLESMVPACAVRSPAAARPMRCVFVFAPNGQKMDDWTPPSRGPGLELPPILDPLAPHRRSVVVLSGLALDGARAHGDGPGDHARAAAAFLTCAHPRKTGGSDIHAGVSIDQVIARGAGQDTRFASIELGCEPGRSAGICDSGYSCAYTNNISWRAPSLPLAKETSPRELLTRLFGGAGTVDAIERERHERRQRSILDATLADLAQWNARLGVADRQKLEQYTTAVRELELRAARVTDEASVDVPPEMAARASSGDYPDRVRFMYEAIAVALQADLTRTVTLMLGNAGSNRSYRFLDISDGHHDLSHHGKREDSLGKLRQINRWHIEQLAFFLGALESRPDGEGTLLDHTAVVYGSGISDGDRHNHDDLPILVAGGGFRGDRHLHFAPDTPLANLYLTLLRRLGLKEDRFGDSTGTLPGL